MKVKRADGFTLVEILIVVVIMAILAAAVIPQFSDSTSDAKVSTAEYNWHTLKGLLEVYEAQHNGGMPDPLDRLTKKTDREGKVQGESGALGPFIYGPYASDIPTNPWNDSDTVIAQSTAPTAFSVTDGWYYDPATGKLWQAGKEGGTFKLIGDN